MGVGKYLFRYLPFVLSGKEKRNLEIGKQNGVRYIPESLSIETAVWTSESGIHVRKISPGKLDYLDWPNLAENKRDSTSSDTKESEITHVRHLSGADSQRKRPVCYSTCANENMHEEYS